MRFIVGRIWFEMYAETFHPVQYHAFKLTHYPAASRNTFAFAF